MLCDKTYIGETVKQFHNRKSDHLECLYKVLPNNDEVNESKDDYSLGLYLTNEHSYVNRTDFDENYNVSILRNCSPVDLKKKEYNYIYKFNTLYLIRFEQNEPFCSPFSQCLSHLLFIFGRYLIRQKFV